MELYHFIMYAQVIIHHMHKLNIVLKFYYVRFAVRVLVPVYHRWTCSIGLAREFTISNDIDKSSACVNCIIQILEIVLSASFCRPDERDGLMLSMMVPIWTSTTSVSTSIAARIINDAGVIHFQISLGILLKPCMMNSWLLLCLTVAISIASSRFKPLSLRIREVFVPRRFHAQHRVNAIFKKRILIGLLEWYSRSGSCIEQTGSLNPEWYTYFSGACSVLFEFFKEETLSKRDYSTFTIVDAIFTDFLIFAL